MSIIVSKKEQSVFASCDQLKGYLIAEGVSVDGWGAGDAKTIEHLFNELSKGEAFLVKTEEGLVRKVIGVSVRVYYHHPDGRTLYLREQKQVFTDGRVRTREWFEWSLSEKMNPGENCREAVRRALGEELGIFSEVESVEMEKNINDTTSQSYPGLRTQYENNFFNAFLSDNQFNPDGYIEIQSDKKTYWVWEQ